MADKADEKLVIYHFSDAGLEDSTVRELKFDAGGKPDFKFVALRKVVQGVNRLVEATFSHRMADFIGIEEMGMKTAGDHAPIIWEMHPLDENWFKKLADEGHTGKRILVSTSQETTDAIRPFATDIIEIPTEDFADQIFEALKSESQK